jgi:hypothetical protein
MAQFAIMRVKKLKSLGAVKGMAKHNFRSIDTPNANPNKTPENDHRACTDVFETMDKYKSLLPKKVRKDAVHALDYLITTSPEATKEDNRIAIEEGIKWVEDRHGKENILLSSIHLDETTPHVHIVAMPLRNGKLNAKHFVGGSKHRMSELQDEYFARVENKTNLARGIKGSRAKHQTTAAWNAAKKKALSEAVNLPSKADLMEQVALSRKDLINPEKANNRVSEMVDEVLGEVESIVMQAETHKTERIREKHEMRALSRDNQKLSQVKEDFKKRSTDPEYRVLEIKRLTKLQEAYQYGRNKIEAFQGRVRAFFSRSVHADRETRVLERVRPSRDRGREWCPTSDLHSASQAPTNKRTKHRYPSLQR